MSELNRRMSALDASFLYLEQPNALLHVAALYTVHEPLDFDAFVDDVRRKLPLVPRYVQRVAMVPFNLGHPTWEYDPAFDIQNHIFRHRLEGDGDDQAMASLAAELFAQPLDRDRPMWTMHVIEGYRGNGTAVLANTHHCMIDGASGVDLINLLMDTTPKPAPLRYDLALPAPSQLPSAFARALEGLSDSVRSQFDILERVAETLSDPSSAIDEARATAEAAAVMARTVLEGVTPMPFNGPLSEQRAIAWTKLSLNEVKALKSRFGGTVNDVVLCVIAGGLGSYLQGRGVKVIGKELKAMVPVNTRAAAEKGNLGNRVSGLVAELPIGIADAISRLRHISAGMDLLKNSGQAEQMSRVVSLADLLPPMLQRPLAQFQGMVSPVHTVCTNVPGPRERRYLLGKPVEMMAPLVPLGANIGMAFAILSYADQLTIGINADAAREADPWRVARAISDSFDGLWAASGLERKTQAVPVESALKRRERRTEPA